MSEQTNQSKPTFTEAVHHFLDAFSVLTQAFYDLGKQVIAKLAPVARAYILYRTLPGYVLRAKQLRVLALPAPREEQVDVL